MASGKDNAGGARETSTMKMKAVFIGLSADGSIFVVQLT
jgi:hypothetical protein